MHARPMTLPDLWPIVVPVTASALVLGVGGWFNRRWAPMQAGTLQALQARIALLESEKSECQKQISEMGEQLGDVQATVADLREQVRVLTAENLELRRRLPDGPRRPAHA